MEDKPDEAQDAMDNVECMNTLYNEIYALFQSKTARLKKQVTHWYGKFCIVKMENNKLRMYNRRQRKYLEAQQRTIAFLEKAALIETINEIAKEPVSA